MALSKELREDLNKYIEEHYVEPQNEWPNRWWEPGCEDIDEAPAPDEEEAEMDLPF